jgi:hypothetical protein
MKQVKLSAFEFKKYCYWKYKGSSSCLPCLFFDGPNSSKASFFVSFLLSYLFLSCGFPFSFFTSIYSIALFWAHTMTKSPSCHVVRILKRKKKRQTKTENLSLRSSVYTTTSFWTNEYANNKCASSANKF